MLSESRFTNPRTYTFQPRYRQKQSNLTEQMVQKGKSRSQTDNQYKYKHLTLRYITSWACSKRVELVLASRSWIGPGFIRKAISCSVFSSTKEAVRRLGCCSSKLKGKLPSLDVWDMPRWLHINDSERKLFDLCSQMSSIDCSISHSAYLCNNNT